MYFALDSVIEALGDRVDPERVALGGHSLGGMTTYGAAYNSCCTQPRIDAALVLSGVEAPFPDGDYTDRPAIPLLLAHGDLDATIVSSSSDDLFSKATGPVAFVRYPEGTHSSILRDENGELLLRASLAWLDRWLLDDVDALDDLTSRGRRERRRRHPPDTRSRARVDVDVVALLGPDVELAGAGDLRVLLEQLLPVRQPARRAGDGEQHR